ncbi:unnamed protein product [Bursaphelenchus okinawaensis]|uniref:Peptidase M20 dimerisation domain-containing protein n=1 Tax=Bursaphelenchus okinawaensis TaxID=465554 RepID=A0A811JTT5_9BILA|nr:unnamed protein product [Bursaphelenchus okinawaensis]CAG9082876.1 unnamed protein product [Bursaphelenchus okinawaensis]
MEQLSNAPITDFLIHLMKIESTTGQEAAVADCIQRFCEFLGFEVVKQSLKPNYTRCNLLIKKPNTKIEDIKYLLNTHLDTVPPYTHPRIGDGCIYGRGSNDAKGQIASMIFALRKLKGENEQLSDQTALLLVVGEETDHVGMTEANNLNIHPKYLVVGEPTELTFGHAQKGALKIQLVARGQAAHSGYPEKGHSAVHLLLDVLANLRANEWPQHNDLGETTLNIGLLNGGQAMNALAEHAEAGLMFRVVDSASNLLEEVERIVKGRVEIKVLGLNEPVILTKPPEPFESKVVAFNTDIPYFDKYKQLDGVFLIGCGSITTAHSKHEYVPIEELEQCPELLYSLLTKLHEGSEE